MGRYKNQNEAVAKYYFNEIFLEAVLKSDI